MLRSDFSKSRAHLSLVWEAHAPSRARCGASPQCSAQRKVRDGEGAIGPNRPGVCTRGACAPRRSLRRTREKIPKIFDDARGALRRIAILSVAMVVTANLVHADFLHDTNRMLSLGDGNSQFHLRITGLLDLEGYYLDQPAPGLIETEDHSLFNPRLTIFVDARWTKYLYFFGQVRLDRGFDPSDEGAQIRLDEYFLRYKPLGNSRLNFQIGKFATVVGNWVQRHYSWDNPFVTAPLTYENLTNIWDVAAPQDVDDLLHWAHVTGHDYGDYSDKYLRLPIIWGPSYASGIALTGAIDRFDYAIELKNSALASRPEEWDAKQMGFSDPTYSGRIGFRPNEMWNIGLSVSSGAYLLPEAAPTLPRGTSIGDFREKVLAQDISFAWHHLQ